MIIYLKIQWTEYRTMRVLKRGGQLQEVSFDKVLQRIKKLCDLEPKCTKIDPTELAQKVITRIYDKVSTVELDELAAQIAVSLGTLDLEWQTLANRIIISNNHKNTDPVFSRVIEKLFSKGLVSKKLYAVVQEHKDVLDNAIDHQRDYTFDYFSFKTLERAYLIKIDNAVQERIQYMWMRVALGIHADDIPRVLQTYEGMSSKFFTHATPTLFHAGTERPQLLSCFLLGIQDSVDGIYKTISDCAMISKWAGGIGIHVSNIRAKNSLIRGTNGKTDGIIPMLRVFNETARYINQCFTPNTIVYTQEGHQTIDSISRKDFVLTRDGSFKRVLGIARNHVEESIMNIRTAHSIEPVQCTNVHEICVLRNQKKMTPFKKIYEKLDSGAISPEFIPAEEVRDDDFMLFPIPSYELDIPEYSEDICRMYGIILGDGHYTKKNNCNSIECGVTCGFSKQDTISFIKEFLQKRNIHFWLTEGTNCVSIRWTYDPLKFPITYSQIYNTNQEKHVVSDFLHLPRQKQLQIVKGLLETDGCVQNEIYFNSTSRSLIEAMRYMLLCNRILTSGNLRKSVGKVSSYRNIKTIKQPYVLRIPKHTTISTLLGITPSTFLKFLEHDNMLYSRVKSIDSVEYSGYVYDLNVEDNHNYVTHMGLVHNSGKRNGSFAIYLEPWHDDVFEFIECRKNHGDENARARDLFYALWIPDLFMKRVQEDGEWHTFCPDTCPNLVEHYGEEFEHWYNHYVEQKMFRRTFPARKLWVEILKAQMETGTPYLLYKDAVNNKSNQKNLGIIKSSNLCCEITEFSDHKEYACCTLASIGLPNFVSARKFNFEVNVTIFSKPNCSYCTVAEALCKRNGFTYTKKVLDVDYTMDELRAYISSQGHTPPERIRFPQIIMNSSYVGGFNGLHSNITPVFDFENLMKYTRTAIRNLDLIIDLNYYPVPETELSNKRHRPLGLGVQGLADVYAKMGYAFDSPEAAELNKKIFACIYYAAMEESVQLAKEKGAYETFKGSPLSKGQFQFDLWETKPLTNISPECILDWDQLRKEVMEHGARNSLLLAPMPTASTAQILGNNECIEPYTNNIYVRRVLAGDFVVINKYLIRDLTDMGLWSEEMKNRIIMNNGSVQNIDEIPLYTKKIYKTVWDLSQKALIDQAADRGVYICQSQSLNLFLANPTIQNLSSMHFYTWKKGLKTGIYYLRSRPAANAQQFTVDPRLYQKFKNKESECESCSG